jgi:hypothetical protein
MLISRTHFAMPAEAEMVAPVEQLKDRRLLAIQTPVHQTAQEIELQRNMAMVRSTKCCRSGPSFESHEHLSVFKCCCLAGAG